MDETLVDRIYEAAAVPELWSGVLAEVARIAGAQDALLVAVRGKEFGRWIVSSPEFEGFVHDHLERFRTNIRTERLIATRHAGFVTDLDVLTEREIAVDPLYQDYLIPKGFGWGVATAIAAPSGDSIIVHAERRGVRGPVGREAVERLDQLRPHFARSALLSARLEMERAQAATAALEMIGLPGAVLAKGGRIVTANALFAGLVPDVVQDRAARAALADPAADRLLARALDDLGRAHSPTVRSIPIRANEGRPPTIVHLVPVRGAAHDVFANATAILIVTPVVPSEVPSATVVQGLFDLTPSEAKLASLVAAGKAPRDASRALGVTESTARTTLKRVFAKSGVSRQSELVSLLATPLVGI